MWHWHFVRAQEIARERQAEAAEWRRARAAVRSRQLDVRGGTQARSPIGRAASATQAGT